MADSARWVLVLVLAVTAVDAVGDCFCLEDQFRVMYYGCREGAGGVVCNGYPQPIPNSATMTRVGAGVGQCNPCAPQGALPPVILRGGEDLDERPEAFDE